MFFKITKKVTEYLCATFSKNCHQELLKIALSGNTVIKWHSAIDMHSAQSNILQRILTSVLCILSK